MQNTITSIDPVVAAGIQRMVTSHWHSVAATADEQINVITIVGGVTLSQETSYGQQLEKLRALGFIGWLTSTMHHQTHPLALARGESPH